MAKHQIDSRDFFVETIGGARKVISVKPVTSDKLAMDRIRAYKLTLSSNLIEVNDPDAKCAIVEVSGKSNKGDLFKDLVYWSNKFWRVKTVVNARSHSTRIDGHYDITIYRQAAFEPSYPNCVIIRPWEKW